MLSVSDLHAGYGRTAVLSGVDLHVGAGEIVAVLGRNGVGKTTLLRAIMGLLPAWQGRIMLDGHGDLTRLPAHARARAGLAYVPQGRQIFPRLSVRDNLRVAAPDISDADARDTLAPWVAWSGLQARHDGHDSTADPRLVVLRRRSYSRATGVSNGVTQPQQN